MFAASHFRAESVQASPFMCLMHHLLDTHLGFVVACGVQIACVETTAPICRWMGFGSVVCGMYEAVSGFKAFPW